MTTTTTTNTTSVASEAPGLRLFVLQHQGQEQDYVWEWPAHATWVGFDRVLQDAAVASGFELTDATLVPLRLCTIERAGTYMEPVWFLRHGSDALVCSVNQNLLEMDRSVRLDQGDEIEVGLTRLWVALDASTQGPHTAPAQAHTSSPPIDGQFQLTDLDLTLDAPGLRHERYGSERADFSDLISFAPETRTAVEPAATKRSNAQSELEAQGSGGAAQPRQPVPAAVASVHATQAAHGAGQVASPEDLLRQLSKDVEAAFGERVQEHDPLEVLHTKYLAKLRNPALSGLDAAWQMSGLGEQVNAPDPMQLWSDKAGNQQGLDDLLGQSNNIGVVLAALDPLQTSNVMAPEPYDSVMHLFAPEDLRQRDEGTLEQFLQRSLPGLTRLEHHSLSLDSAMPFIGGELPPTKPPEKP